jgi:hypothetical protein
MPYLVYFFVLLVAAASVLFGLDWLHAPLPPMPDGKQVQAMRVPATPAVRTPPLVHAQDSAQQDSKPAAARVSESFATLGTPAPASVQPEVAATNALSVANGPAGLDAAAATNDESASRCDIVACANAYRTFRESDCTYQPSDGPRRLCTKGMPPSDSAAASTQAPNARAQATCNVTACARAYSSFNASDCTYQPYDGPRRLCAK